MQYIKGKDFKLENTSVTFGKFDGIHLGHRELIAKVAENPELTSVLFTFDLNPIHLFSDKDVRLIYTNTERVKLLDDTGLNILIDYPFTEETANTSAEDFIKEVIGEKLKAKRVVVGTDFRFGKNREGDIALLEKKCKEYGYELVVVEKKLMYGEEISSTGIRNLLRKGEMKKIKELLGRPYSVSGEIIHGRKIGKTISMPTINQRPEMNKLLPPYGVYVSDTVIRGEVFRGVTNVGVNPTVGTTPPGVETLLFDFDRDVYGEHADVFLLAFIRPEEKFDTLEELRAQVSSDEAFARKYKD